MISFLPSKYYAVKVIASFKNRIGRVCFYLVLYIHLPCASWWKVGTRRESLKAMERI